MSDQTNSATDPIIDLIPAELRDDYARLNRSIDLFDERIASLQRERRAELDERQAIIDMAATDMNNDLGLVALRKSGAVAEQRLTDEVRAISPLLHDTIEFSATGTDINYPGPYVSLMNHKTRPVADVDPAELAAALVEFARRFCPVPPETGEYAGMVCADILTERDGLTMLYAPDGSKATLFIGRSREVSGTLIEVTTAAIREAKRATEPVDEPY